MRSAAIRLSLLALAGLAAVGWDGIRIALAQPAQPANRVEPGLAITCELFCSDTKLRVSNARLRWSLTRAALTANNISNLAGASQTLEVTVYKNGFDKGLMVALPLAGATPDRPVLAVAAPQAPAQVNPQQVRAFQIRLIEIEPLRAATADADAQMGAVVENLDPGVNYSWRIVINTPAGRIVSRPTTCQANVCPADLVPTPTPPARRRGR
jgi:hypothetical protein